MKVRRPKLDFSDSSPVWCKSREFSQFYNAGSLVTPYLEPFLNKVMLQAAKALGASAPDAKLKKDIEIFVQQESNHYRMHRAYNEMLTRAGYDQLAGFEQLMREEFDRMFKSNSLRFNVSYSQGFETFGPVFAGVWLDQLDDILEGADTAVVNLWKWHWMEEYEHRTVCHDVYLRLFGRRWNSYFYRVYGFFYAFFHLGSFQDKVANYLLAKDRDTLSPEEVRQSKKNARRIKNRVLFAALPGFALALLPFYNPERLAQPKRYSAFQGYIEGEFGIRS
jgi:predicted metal-dependent hydrolase